MSPDLHGEPSRSYGQRRHPEAASLVQIGRVFPCRGHSSSRLLSKPRALIADERRWCRRHLAHDVNGIAVSPTSTSAVKRCALGAVIAAAYELTHDLDAAHQLRHEALRPRYGAATLIHVNDVRGHAAVLALFDEVIAAG